MEQGLPYYRRFIERFPDVFSLAEASEAEVLKLWQGLGYYSRARNLHHTAMFVARHCDGKFPRRYEDLVKLKGIGPYTAAAIASIGFNEAVPVVDGNVERVISRLYALDYFVNDHQGKKKVHSLADDLLDRSNPGRHNQAMMELGALICTPIKPSCAECPLGLNCKARSIGIAENLPLKQKKSRAKDWQLLYFDLHYHGRPLIYRRSENGIWPLLHEPPMLEIQEAYTPDIFENMWTALQEKYCFSAEIEAIGMAQRVKHQLTHKNITAHFLPIDLKTLALKNNAPIFLTSHSDIRVTLGITRLYEKYLERRRNK
jgi:A/G-specific adenine glycosylase